MPCRGKSSCQETSNTNGVFNAPVLSNRYRYGEHHGREHEVKLGSRVVLFQRCRILTTMTTLCSPPIGIVYKVHPFGQYKPPKLVAFPGGLLRPVGHSCVQSLQNQSLVPHQTEGFHLKPIRSDDWLWGSKYNLRLCPIWVAICLVPSSIVMTQPVMSSNSSRRDDLRLVGLSSLNLA